MASARVETKHPAGKKKTIEEYKQDKIKAVAQMILAMPRTVVATEEDAAACAASTLAIEMVRDQGGRGAGLKAKKDFKGGQLVALFARTPYEEENITNEQFCHSVEVGEEFFVGTAPGGGMACLINDVCSPKTIEDLNTCEGVASVQRWAQKYADEMKQLVHSANINFIRMRSGTYAFAVVDIKAGTDLLTMYSAEWWIDRAALLETNSFRVRLSMVCWLLQEGFFPVLGWIRSLWGVRYNKIGSERAAGMLINYWIDRRGEMKEVSSESESDALQSEWLRHLGFDLSHSKNPSEVWSAECDRVDTPRSKKKKKAKKNKSRIE